MFHELSAEQVVELQPAAELAVADEPVDRRCGGKCASASGAVYYWGPEFGKRIAQWQDFVLRLYAKRGGYVFHYSRVSETRHWTPGVRRVAVNCPLTEQSASGILRLVEQADGDQGLIFSGALLTDLLLAMRSTGIPRLSASRQRVVFTTFEQFDPQPFPEFNEMFGGGWCSYMRDWRGGLSWYRCAHGTLHSLDHICGVWLLHGKIHATDYLNQAQRFRQFPTGLFGRRLKEPQICACGAWHFGLQVEGWHGSLMINDRGMTVDAMTACQGLPCGWQAFQERKGHVLLLKADGWAEGEGEVQAKQFAEIGLKAEVRRGWMIKGSKKPPFGSAEFTPRVAFTIHSQPQIKARFEPL